MNIYIWARIKRLTSHYHDEGGVVVIAETLEQAQALIPRTPWRSDPLPPIEAPTAVYQLHGDAIEPQCWVFPDAGCC